MRKTTIFAYIIVAALIVAISAACDSGSQPTADSPIQGKTIKTGAIGDNLTVTLSSASGTIKNGQQEIFLAFTDGGGKPVDVGAASLNFFMPAMGSMSAMNNAASLTTTPVPGIYRGSVRIDAVGEWQAQISFEGTAGSGKTSFSLRAQ